MKGNDMPKQTDKESRATYMQRARDIAAAVQRGEIQVPKPPEKPAPLTNAEKLQHWRAMNPDKVRAAIARASATRAAKNAPPPGSACGVCGTGSSVTLDHKRGGVLCRDCHGAVRFAENADRAATYAGEIARYRAAARAALDGMLA